MTINVQLLSYHIVDIVYTSYSAILYTLRNLFFKNVLNTLKLLGYFKVYCFVRLYYLWPYYSQYNYQQFSFSGFSFQSKNCCIILHNSHFVLIHNNVS